MHISLLWQLYFRNRFEYTYFECSIKRTHSMQLVHRMHSYMMQRTQSKFTHTHSNHSYTTHTQLRQLTHTQLIHNSDNPLIHNPYTTPTTHSYTTRTQLRQLTNTQLRQPTHSYTTQMTGTQLNSLMHNSDNSLIQNSNNHLMHNSNNSLIHHSNHSCRIQRLAHERTCLQSLLTKASLIHNSKESVCGKYDTLTCHPFQCQGSREIALCAHESPCPSVKGNHRNESSHHQSTTEYCAAFLFPTMQLVEQHILEIMWCLIPSQSAALATNMKSFNFCQYGTLRSYITVVLMQKIACCVNIVTDHTLISVTLM